MNIHTDDLVSHAFSHTEPVGILIEKKQGAMNCASTARRGGIRTCHVVLRKPSSRIWRDVSASTLLVGLLVAFCWSASLAHSAVLYRSKDEGFRIELRGYIKNFLLLQTGVERFLPAQPPKDLKDLEYALKSLGILSSAPAASWDEFRRQLGTTGYDLLRIRLHTKIKWSESVSLQFAYEIRPQVTSDSAALLSALPVLGPLFAKNILSFAGGSANFGAYTNFDDRFLDFPRTLFRTYSTRLDHELDRFFVSWALPFADITFGRQSIIFGVGQLFRPTDIFAPFSPQEIDKLERRGVDALKIEFPLGDLGELALVGVVSRLYPATARSPSLHGYFDNPSFGGAARIKLSQWGFDIFALVGYVQHDIAVGLGFSGSLLGAGLRAEAVYRYRLPSVENEPHQSGILSASVGLDYNLASKLPWLKLILGLEYFHNGAGTHDPSLYLQRSREYRYLRGDVFNLGADYLAFFLQWEIHPLLSLQAFVMLNLHDQSALFAPQFAFSIKEDISIFVMAYFGLGSPPDASFVPSQQNAPSTEAINLKLASEFGAIGIAVILGARIFF